MFSPPSSSHSGRSKGKENVAPRRRTVDWASTAQIYWISSDADVSSSSISCASSSSSFARPKSILKPSKPLPPLPFPVPQPREHTPQPNDPLDDATYLCWPINTVLSKSSTIRERMEAYCILMARVKNSIEASTRERKVALSSSVKLFTPMRENTATLTLMMIQDLGGVLIDPLDDSSRLQYPDSDDIEIPKDTESEDVEKTSKAGLGIGLPSPPKESPKRGGLSESQVKRSRDLCMLTHAVLKFLHVALGLNALSSIFSGKSLQPLYM